jgi:hypothetical protein
MTQRAKHVAAAADLQIEQLLSFVKDQTRETLQRPCPGRQKLGDGSLGAFISHMADNWQRIADFAAGRGQQLPGHSPPARTHKMPRFLTAFGHRRPDHTSAYSADAADPQEIASRLIAARGLVTQIGALSEQQLDAVPAEGSFRFCDGKRNLEEVLRALLRHQDRQIGAIRSARVADGRGR